MGYVNDYSLAQDMAQETFIKVWQYLPTFRNEANIDTWICLFLTVFRDKLYFTLEKLIESERTFIRYQTLY